MMNGLIYAILAYGVKVRELYYHFIYISKVYILEIIFLDFQILGIFHHYIYYILLIYYLLQSI